MGISLLYPSLLDLILFIYFWALVCEFWILIDLTQEMRFDFENFDSISEVEDNKDDNFVL